MLEHDRSGKPQNPGFIQEKNKQFIKIAPGPQGHWLLGSLPERRREPLKFFLSSNQKYGHVVRFKMGPVTVHLLSHPEHIKHVLADNAKNYHKGFGYDKLEPVLGQGLLNSEGEFWHRQRRLAQPAFHQSRLKLMSETMVRATRELIEKWERREDPAAPLDVAPEMMRLTLRVVGQTLMGVDVADAADDVGRVLPELLEEANTRALSITRLREIVPTPTSFRFKENVATLDKLVFRTIEERRKNPADHPDLLSMFMAAQDTETGERMDNKQLRDEIMTMFLAGHETTANLLSWTWVLLSQHPECARRVLEEVSRVLGDGDPTFEKLGQLTYTTQVLEESLRLYPPAWILARQVLEADEVGGYHLPKESMVLISPYITHHNADFWDNPEGFDPERFRPEAVAQRAKFAYFPFGGGPRLCIGFNFALMEAKIILSMLLRKFKLELVPGHTIEPEPQITLRPKHGVLMWVRPRQT